MTRAWQIAASVLLGATLLETQAEAKTVELELLLALDISQSVDAAEYALQARGLAAAFRHPDVLAAIRAAGDDGVAVSLVQWADIGQQSVVVDWTEISSAASAEALARRIERMPRLVLGSGTAISDALEVSIPLFWGNGFEGRRRVIDVSGDGSDNRGPMPERQRDRAISLGITINALAIRNEEPFLDTFYRNHVIGGTGAFVMTAADYVDFAEAIVRKLIREIAGPALARRGEPGGGELARNPAGSVASPCNRSCP